jgi:hypothetical protein
MSVYQLNRNEAWALATLINLPIQEGSVIGEWLGAEEMPTYETVQDWIPQVTNTLSGKGYLQKSSSGYQFHDELLNALLLIALGQEFVNIRLRIAQEAGETSFVLSGTGLVQYGFNDDRLVFHQPKQLDEMLPVLLPEWISVGEYEGGIGELTLSSFLLFRQACLLKDMAFVLRDQHDPSFLRAELVDSFMRNHGWLDVYHALGLESAPNLNDVSLADDIGFLIDQHYLTAEPDLSLSIGIAGEPLYKTLADPNYVAVTIGLISIPKVETNTIVFLAGGSRLFLLFFNGDKIKFRQLRSYTAGIIELQKYLKPG